MSIAGEAVCTFAYVRQRETAKAFYGGVLGLPLKKENQYGVMFALHNAALWVMPMADFAPSPHPVIGWTVADVPATVRRLAEAGIVFERYDFLEQDELGICRSDGTEMAWFKDPDGNVLSIASLS